MAYLFLDTLSTPSIKAVQAAEGVADTWANFRGHRTFDRFTENEKEHIAERDSFYMATVTENGWPYVQHRGGPKGFVRVLDDKTLALADFRGNRQYISVGNLRANDRVALIFMDYPQRRRLKVLGHVEIKDLADAPDLATKLALPGYKAKVERAMLIHLEAFDWNCSQHITPRFTEEEVADALAPMRRRLEELEAENKSLRAAASARAQTLS